MSTVWQSLLWKELREHRGKMLALAFITLAILCAAWSERPRDWAVGAMHAGLALSGICAVFVGIGVAAGENSRRTRPFIEAQPQPLELLAATKLLVGALTSLVPSVVVTVFVVVLIGLQTQSADRVFNSSNAWFGGNYYVGLFLLSSVVALSLYLWTVALAVRSRDEIHAALWSACPLVAWVVVIMNAFNWSRGNNAVFELFVVLATLGPLGFLTASADVDSGIVLKLLASLAVHLGLVWWFIQRFAGPATSTIAGSALPSMVTNRLLLAPPRRSQLTALMWKLRREALPLILIGLTAAVGIAFVVEYIDRSVSYARPDSTETLRRLLEFTLAAFALFVAIVLGLAVVWGDLQPGINTFWRSRPVSPDLWFATKLLGSLAMLAIGFGVPHSLLSISIPANAVLTAEDYTIGWLSTLFGFALAVLFATVLRHAIYACLLSLGWGVTTAVLLASREIDVISIDSQLVCVGLLAMGAIFAAWWAYRKDWAVRW